jgi:hypothetical protein
VQDETAASEGQAGEKGVAERPVDELTTIEEVQAAMDDPGVSKTRKQKLKQRLKQLQVLPCRAGKCCDACLKPCNSQAAVQAV